ncbi:MAG: metallophosphoesterase [Oscillospiraceae bacterium]
MICITGDMHGDLSRFNDKRIKALKKNDFLIVCGDFGFIWDGSKHEQKILKKIGKKRFYTLFVDGCHENFDLLGKYPERDLCGGIVHQISGNLMHIKRGSVLSIQGYKFFGFGGGQTKEIDIRRESNTWFEAELPRNDEIEYAAENIRNAGNEVDYIVTHEPPASMKEFLGFEVNQISYMHTFFDRLKSECKFKMWFFGKAHINKLVPPKYRCLFDEVVVLKNEKWDKEQKLLRKNKRKIKKNENTPSEPTSDSFE